MIVWNEQSSRSGERELEENQGMSQEETAKHKGRRGRGSRGRGSGPPDREDSSTSRSGKRGRMAEVCEICNKGIERGRYLECALCDILACQRCTSVSDSLFDAFMYENDQGFTWMCKNCQTKGLPSIKDMTKAMFEIKDGMKDMRGQMSNMEESITEKLKAELPQIIKQEVREIGKEIEKKIEKKVDEMEKVVINKVDKLEEKVERQVKDVHGEIQGMKRKMAQKEDVGELVKEELRRELKKRDDEIKKRRPTENTQGPMDNQGNPVSPGSQMRMTVASVAKEIRDKEERRKSFVIYNLEEPQTNDKEDRITQDKERVAKVVQEVLGCDLDVEGMGEAIRLGKDKTEGKRSPLLITVKEERTKYRIFSRLIGLRGSDYDHLSFAHDMTKMEREQQRKKIIEAKKKDGEEGGKWKHRVRGPPWDLRIVRMEAKTETQEDKEEKMEEVVEGK